MTTETKPDPTEWDLLLDPQTLEAFFPESLRKKILGIAILHSRRFAEEMLTRELEERYRSTHLPESLQFIFSVLLETSARFSIPPFQLRPVPGSNRYCFEDIHVSIVRVGHAVYQALGQEQTHIFLSKIVHAGFLCEKPFLLVLQNPVEESVRWVFRTFRYLEHEFEIKRMMSLYKEQKEVVSELEKKGGFVTKPSSQYLH